MQLQTPDTITTAADSTIPKVMDYTHVFKNNELSASSNKALELKNTQLLWPAGVFMTAFILLVAVRVASYKRFLTLLKAYFSLGISRQLMREEYKLNKGSSVLYSIVFILCMSFFLFKINQLYGFNSYSFNHFIFYLLVCGGLLLVYAFKIIGSVILSGLMNATNENDEYIFNLFLSTNATGLFLFPLVICMEYSNIPTQYLVYAGVVVFLLFYIIRIGKGILIAYNSKRFSVFHLFLYLCALEILPLIVLIKLFVSKIF